MPHQNPTPSKAQMLKELLDERYSCRAFRPDPVDRAIIEDIVETAQRSASWCNSQPWELIVTTGTATDRLRGDLFDHALTHPADSDFPFPAAYTGVYKDRRRQCASLLYESVGIAMNDREASARQTLENFRFFGAPHLAVITTEKDLGVYGAVDCGAFVNMFLLAARSLGVATIAQAAIAMHSGFLRDYLAIPDTRAILCGISFGYEVETHPVNAFRTPRAKASEVIRWIED